MEKIPAMKKEQFIDKCLGKKIISISVERTEDHGIKFSKYPPQVTGFDDIDYGKADFILTLEDGSKILFKGSEWNSISYLKL